MHPALQHCIIRREGKQREGNPLLVTTTIVLHFYTEIKLL